MTEFKNISFYEKVNDFKEIDYDRYILAKNKLFKPYYEKNEHVFKNYLIHNIFTEIVPNNNEDFELALNNLLIPYLLMQIFIIGVNSKDKYIGTDDIINSIYYYHRVTNHLMHFTSDTKKDHMKNKKDDLINMDLNLAITLLNL